MIAPPLPPDEPRRLQALHGLCLLDTPAELRFDRIVRTAARVFRVPIALVSLLDGERQWFKARVGLEAETTPRSVSFCGHAILTPDTFVVQNALQDGRFFDNPLVTGTPHIRFYAGHPVRATDGSAVGTLCVMDREPRDFSLEHRQLLADMASWVELEFNALTVQQARTALAQKERFFELSVDILCILGLDGRFQQASKACARALGYPEEALRALSLLGLVHEQDRAATAEWLAQGARGGPLPRFEHRCRGRDGGWHWLQWSAVAQPEEGIVYGVARDVTQQKQLESERRMVEQMKNEFVSTVSHELRTPLTSIRGALGLLSGGVAGPLPSMAADMIGIAHKNSERLIRLVNDMLDLEKMESGNLDFQLTPVALGPLVAQAIQAHLGYAQERGVRLQVVDEAPGAQAVVDEGRFLQVLANLLSNAVKFSPEGECVVLRLGRHGEHLRVSVEDRGPGIPEAFRARIFQKFAQADGSDTRRRGGTGLGLSIAQSFMEKMGGVLQFTSTEGVGTTFWAELPEWRATERQPPSASTAEVAATARPSRPRVLHVEADVDNRRVVADVLREVAEVVAASSLAEAEAALRTGPFALIIAEPPRPEGAPLTVEPLLTATPVLLFSVRSRASNAELRSAVLRLLRPMPPVT